jgi:hypothetical protein
MMIDEPAVITVTYFPNKIVLRGETRKIHTEAYKILTRFKYSPTPYYVNVDSSHLVELTTKDYRAGK